jgi:uncharacterized protein YjbJ (UPF0337 family)
MTSCSGGRIVYQKGVHFYLIAAGNAELCTEFIAGDSKRTHVERRMDWDRFAGNWKQLKGKIREKWGELTDDDLAAINGRREQLEGKLQERYGYARDQARKEVEDWCKANTDQI